MTIAELIDKHTIVPHPNGPSQQALKQFAIDLLEHMKEQSPPTMAGNEVEGFRLESDVETAIDQALEELRK